MKSRFLPILASVLALGVASLAHAETVLTVGAGVFPKSLQTGQSSFAALSLIAQTNEALVGRDDQGNLHPGLAEAWEPIDDTTMRFTLRKGVKWHDGTEFTAKDVVFTINRIVDPATAYGLLARIGQVSGAELVDDHTVDIKTKSVFPTLARALSDIVIEPEHYYAAVGAEAVVQHPVGTGPFVFARYVPGDRYELTANPDYWGGAPKVDKLVIREIPEAATRVASLIAGETQIIEEVPVDLIEQIEASGNAKVEEITTSAGLILTFDVRTPPFDNPKVREAFDYAIDKPTIFEAILKSKGELLDGQLLTKATLGHNPDISARPYDPEKARALLEEAGFDFNTTVSIATQSGKYTSDVDIVNAVVGMLGDIGVQATVNVVEGGVWSQMTQAKDYGPMYMIGWYSLGDADFASVWFTELGKRSVWINPEYDALFTEARSTTDETRRIAAYNRMMEIMHTENPAIFLFGLPSLYGVSDAISGYSPASDKVLRAAKVSIAE